MSRLCTILARGGSKGVPNKNVRILAGKPLIAHSILRAKESGLFDAVAVSSDSAEILRIAETFKADHRIMRPIEMATDTAPKIPAVRHAVTESERLSGKSFEIICDLDPTSPFRSAEDIRAAVRMCETEPGRANVITGAPSRKSPYFNMVEIDAHGAVGLSKRPPAQVVRRQDAPKCYDMNASIYVWKREALFAEDHLFNPMTKLYAMPPERSVEIDSELDFILAEAWAAKGHL